MFPQKPPQCACFQHHFFVFFRPAKPLREPPGTLPGWFGALEPITRPWISPQPAGMTPLGGPEDPQARKNRVFDKNRENAEIGRE